MGLSGWGPLGGEVRFEVEPFRKDCLLEGLDDIDLTLEHGTEIDAFEAAQKQRQPWLYGSPAE